MCIYVVWIDRERAKLLKIASNRMERKDFQAISHANHSNEIDQEKIDLQERRFFLEIIPHLMETKNLLIVGPNVVKYNFQNFLLEHYPIIGKKVIACETMEEPTDNEIASLAKKYFQISA